MNEDSTTAQDNTTCVYLCLLTLGAAIGAPFACNGSQMPSWGLGLLIVAAIHAGSSLVLLRQSNRASWLGLLGLFICAPAMLIEAGLFMLTVGAVR